jgi:hypothetical protein
MACTGGRALFFVSVLSHDESKKTAALKTTMFKFFMQNSG